MNDLKFTFSPEQTNLILGALQELPFKMSAGLLAEMEKQLKAQMPDNPEPQEFKDPKNASAGGNVN